MKKVEIDAGTMSSILERQRRFNERFFDDLGHDLESMSIRERSGWTKEFVLHVEDELHELLGETNWKMHRASSARSVSRSNLLEEWIDAFKFLLGLANVWGFSAEEIVEEFHRKSAVVEYKYAMTRRLASMNRLRDRVVAVDIDGVLNVYPLDFLSWAIDRVGRAEFEDRNPISLPEFRDRVGERRYCDLKDAYRESGEKRYQRVRDGAKELLNGLRAAGFVVVLLSKRPFWRFSRIYADTLEWLDSNELRHDAILFHPEKHRKIVEDFPDLVAMIEDDPTVATEIRKVGHRVIVVKGPENDGFELEGVEFVEGPADALKLIVG